ncbi:MAG TPA: hypothetical protein VHP58_06760 [Alphaproteobacteria bacterium]|nr:hypothetical protein [Alphaproteobacteria bacterium]
MRFVFAHDSKAVRGLGVGYTQEMLNAVRAACGGHEVDIGTSPDAYTDLQAADGIPVFLLLGSDVALGLWRKLTATKQPFVLVDHPHAGEQRHKMVRLAVNGIYAPYAADAPIWEGRTYDWNLQPWRTNLPKTILHCPSAADFYGQWLERDQTHGEFEMLAIIHHLKLMGLIHPDWEVALRTRFENKWAEEHQGARPGADDAILASGAVTDGNSEILFKALRLGTPAFVWEHPGKPLATPLVNYMPLTLDRLSHPRNWMAIDREPFFEQLAMSQCTLDELADPAMFAKLIDWQMTYLPV